MWDWDDDLMVNVVFVLMWFVFVMCSVFVVV